MAKKPKSEPRAAASLKKPVTKPRPKPAPKPKPKKVAILRPSNVGRKSKPKKTKKSGKA